MATERSTAPTQPQPPRLSASSPSPSTVGTLLAKASAAAATGGGAWVSPRSLLSRILHRSGGGGFGCRLRLPRYCSSGAAKEENAADGKDVAKEEASGAAAPKVVGSQAEVRESPRSSLGKKAPEEVSPVSLGLGASLVLLLSKSAAELSRMAELRAQMELLVLDVRAEARSSNISNASDRNDSASVVKGPIVFAGGADTALPHGSRTSCGGGSAGRRAAVAMDHMEAELEAELTRLQFNEECAIPRQDNQLETEAKSDATSVSHSPTCVDDNDCKDDEDDDDCKDEEEEEEEEERESTPHGGVSARELERRLHELLQSRHEERIAELESALERAQRKLQEKELEVCWWRDTAKLVTRHKDESLLR